MSKNATSARIGAGKYNPTLSSNYYDIPTDLKTDIRVHGEVMRQKRLTIQTHRGRERAKDDKKEQVLR